MTSAAIRRGMCVGGSGVTSRLGVLIEYVCDAHARPDPIGPLVTRYDGAWAYCAGYGASEHRWRRTVPMPRDLNRTAPTDRKSTRLNSSHMSISYAVFCLKKKKKLKYQQSSVSVY